MERQSNTGEPNLPIDIEDEEEDITLEEMEAENESLKKSVIVSTSLTGK